MFISVNLSAQIKQDFFIEALGASTTFGIHYDSRFSENTNWGGRIGLAYTNSKSDDFFDDNPQKTTGITIPVAVNYLIGKNKHFAEVGTGISFGWYKCTYRTQRFEMERDVNANFVFLDLGYRYQPTKGLLIRAGVNPSFALDLYKDSHKEHGAQRAAVIYPYIGIGYSF
ncbi:MAG: hypothetical protein K5854_08900 [Prevotella sp.]|nr:hypothetical protein [Prevotella sp.]